MRTARKTAEPIDSYQPESSLSFRPGIKTPWGHVVSVVVACNEGYAFSGGTRTIALTDTVEPNTASPADPRIEAERSNADILVAVHRLKDAVGDLDLTEAIDSVAKTYYEDIPISRFWAHASEVTKTSFMRAVAPSVYAAAPLIAQQAWDMAANASAEQAMNAKALEDNPWRVDD